MKDFIKQSIIETIQVINNENLLTLPIISKDIEILEVKDIIYGDFSTNLAMKISKIQKMSPLKIAEIITKNFIDIKNIVQKIEVAGPGFINFYIKPKVWYSVLREINKKDDYGECDIGKGKSIQIEFVSSNPTGPLHIGHGRGAAIGDSMANIFHACGFRVHKEYYINDSGRQISTLGLSVYLRAKELLNKSIDFPQQCYQGEYIKILAKNFILEKGRSIFNENKEKIINMCADYASRSIVEEIREDLKIFRIDFDHWFSEKTLHKTGKVHDIIKLYEKNGLIYEQDGAKWFATSIFGDEKDRVVVRKNGATTYFASDIAYHMNKFDRGFNQVIDVLGADHHGYIPRIKAVLKASKRKNVNLKIILVKLVNLLRNNKPVTMSTRTGEFITLREVINEVGSDAARFLFLTRHHSSPLDFDIELAKRKSNDNPVYYIQYVHARISSILRKGQKAGLNIISWEKLNLDNIRSNEEIQIIKKLANYPEVIKKSCLLMEPHRISFYLMELAAIFHNYYNTKRILNKNYEVTISRLFLIIAIKKVIRNALKLLGVTAPEKM